MPNCYQSSLFHTVTLLATLSVGGSASAWVDLSAPTTIFTGASGSAQVFPADVNGDGAVDLVSAWWDGTVRWHENDGNETPGFTHHIIASGLWDVPSVFAADMDGDGDTDLVVAEPGELIFNGLNIELVGGRLRWFENLDASPGSFVPNDIAAPSLGRRSCFVADVNGDGFPDVISDVIGTSLWFESSGGSVPTFTPQIALGGLIHHAADIDGDGDTDLLGESNGAVWLENDGAAVPTFAFNSIDVGQAQITGIFAADFNGDENTDLAISSVASPVAKWYESDGSVTPTFSPHDIGNYPLASLFAADLDADGDRDLAVASGTVVDLLQNDASDPGRFVLSASASTAGSMASVFATDLNGDGVTDVVFGTGSAGTVNWSAGIPDPTPVVTNRTTSTQHASFASAFAAAASGHQLRAGSLASTEADIDFMGLDVHLEASHDVAQPVGGMCVLADGATFEVLPRETMSYGAAEVLLREGAGSMSVAGALTAPAGATSLVIAESFESTRTGLLQVGSGGSMDIVGPERLDLRGGIVVEAGAFLGGNGDIDVDPGAWSMDTQVVSATMDANMVRAVDLDGDGDQDLVAGGGSGLRWYENDGAFEPSFTEHVLPGVTHEVLSITTGDMNGDGLMDILSTFGSTIAWHENDGQSPPSFSVRVVEQGVVSGSQSICVGDADRDGDLDVFAAAPALVDHIRWYRNNGGSDPTFTANILDGDFYFPRVVQFCVFTPLSPAPSLVVADQFGEYKIFRRTIDPPYFIHQVTIPSVGHGSIGIADLDSDGDRDIIGIGSGRIRWYEYSQFFEFTEHEVSSDHAFTTGGVNAVDADMDGDLDLVCGYQTGDRIVIYESDGAMPPAFTRVVGAQAGDAPGSTLSGFGSDLNGDGLVDAVSGNTGSVKVHIRTDAPCVIEDGAQIIHGLCMTNRRPMTLNGGSIGNDESLVNLSSMRGHGDLLTSLHNMGRILVEGPMMINGPASNQGRIDIASGQLTFNYGLSCDGSVVLAEGGARGSGLEDLVVMGAFEMAPWATLALPEGAMRIDGEFHAGIDASERFDLATTEVTASGVFIPMQEDIGPDPTGFDRTLPGRFPLGTLRVADALQLSSSCSSSSNSETALSLHAVYVDHLEITSTGSLITDGHRVYYRTLTLDGTVDVPGNLIPVCQVTADANGDGAVDFVDLNELLEQWGSAGPGADFNGDGAVNFVDLNILLEEWGSDCLQ